MAAGNAFQTDMPAELISDMMRQQIDTNAQWSVEEYNLKGIEEEQPLNILGNDEIKVQVLVPDEESVGIAKDKIQTIMDER